MSSKDPKTPAPEELAGGSAWFEEYTSRLRDDSVVLPAQPGELLRCPCCRNRTLSERGVFDICPVCYWEDDGQDDHDAAIVRGGPNGSLSLEQARTNYAAYGASEERFKSCVRAPTPEEAE
jgi:hypothetical protein